jgi:hypothetical protein
MRPPWTLAIAALAGCYRGPYWVSEHPSGFSCPAEGQRVLLDHEPFGQPSWRDTTASLPTTWQLSLTAQEFSGRKPIGEPRLFTGDIAVRWEGASDIVAWRSTDEDPACQASDFEAKVPIGLTMETPPINAEVSGRVVVPTSAGVPSSLVFWVNTDLTDDLTAWVDTTWPSARGDRAGQLEWTIPIGWSERHAVRISWDDEGPLGDLLFLSGDVETEPPFDLRPE